MALRRWRKVSETTVVENPWWRYKRDECILPSGNAGEYHYVHTNGSSLIVPVTAEGLILLVNQYRYLCDRESLEFPCGSVKDGSTYEQTAREELTEETGYAAGELHPLGRFNPYNGVTDEMCHVYAGRHLQHVGSHPDDTEEFEVVSLTPDALDAAILEGTIWDGMTLAAWMISREKVTGYSAAGTRAP